MRVHLVVVGNATVRRLSENSVEVTTKIGVLTTSLKGAQDLRDALDMADLGESKSE